MKNARKLIGKTIRYTSQRQIFDYKIESANYFFDAIILRAERYNHQTGETRRGDLAFNEKETKTLATEGELNNKFWNVNYKVLN